MDSGDSVGQLWGSMRSQSPEESLIGILVFSPLRVSGFRCNNCWRDETPMQPRLQSCHLGVCLLVFQAE
jgi:hypothetical protein